MKHRHATGRGTHQGGRYHNNITTTMLAPCSCSGLFFNPRTRLLELGVCNVPDDGHQYDDDKNEDKENVVNQFSHKKRKNNRYEYYKNRLKKNAIRKKHGSGLKERQNVIKKPKTPQRANPLDFI